MSIMIDEKRNKYYINAKVKDPITDKWKTATIRKAEWVVTGKGKVSMAYMKSIEKDEIEEYKKRSYGERQDGKMSVKELAERFCEVAIADGIDKETVYNYRLAYKNHLYPIVGEDIDAEKALSINGIDRFRMALSKKGFTPSTINNKLIAVRNMLKFAKTRKLLPRDLCDDGVDALKPIKNSKRISSKKTNFFKNGEDDVRKFLDTFAAEDNEWLVPIKTLFYGAFRIGEFLGITKDDVKPEICSIVINKQMTAHGDVKGHTKTNEDRIVRLPKSFFPELVNYIEDRGICDGGYVFVNSQGHVVSRHKIRDLVDKHLKMAELDHITLHGLRHSFATRMFDKGYDVKEVQEHLGHASMETTMHFYIHYTETKAKKDLDDLA